MSDSLGPITLGRKQDQVFLGRDLGRDRDYSEEIAKAIDQEIRKTIDDCYQRAQDILEEDRPKLEKIAQALLEKETLNSKEIKALVEGRELPEDTEEDEDSGTESTLEEQGAGAGISVDEDEDMEEEDIDDEVETAEDDLAKEVGHAEEDIETEEDEKTADHKEDRQASFRQHTKQGEKPGGDY